MLKTATFHLGTACLALTAALALPGCIIVANGYNDTPQYSEVRTIRVPVGSATPVDVTTRNGGVEIVNTTGTEAVITATLRARSQSRLEEARIVTSDGGGGGGGGGKLNIEVAWPDNRPQSGEGCSFRIETPGPNGVHVRTSNGRITLRGCSGSAELDTSNGSIRVADHNGNVNATTSNGRIEGRDITGDLDASTSNGSIDLVNVSGRAFATTSNANITVHLSDTSTGPIQARSSNGTIDLGLGRAFAGELRLSTSNGRIKFDSPVLVKDFESNRSATLQFGTPGVGTASSAMTSNGSITITSHATAAEAPPQVGSR